MWIAFLQVAPDLASIQHQAKLNPEADAERTANIPALGVPSRWALGDGSLLSYVLAKCSHLTNKATRFIGGHEQCLAKLSPGFRILLLRNLKKQRNPLRCAGHKFIFCGRTACYGHSEERIVLSNCAGHIKYNFRNFLWYGLRSERTVRSSSLTSSVSLGIRFVQSSLFWTKLRTDSIFPSWNHQEVKAPPFHW